MSERTESPAIVLPDLLERDASAAPCPCGGYADEVECTEQEISQYQTCGRSYACCIAAFVCRVCGQRLIAKLAAPDMDRF